jgi:ABC-type lipoprotein export system ATPase subunit
MSIKDIANNSNRRLIETVGVTKVFENYGNMVTAVSDVSIKIELTDFVAFYGPTISGKSTLIRILAGVEKPDTGEILVKGEPLYEFSENERAFLRLHKFGLLTEKIHQLNYLNVVENVALPLISVGVNEKSATVSAKELLDRLGFKSDPRKKLLQISKYQAKIALIARALINKPWIVFIDEPYSDLNNEESDAFSQLVSKINLDFQVAIIVATSDPVYLKNANKIYLISEGRLIDFDAGNSPVTRLKDAMSHLESVGRNMTKENEHPVLV